MKQIYVRVLPYLRHLDKHPSWPVPARVRKDLRSVVHAMNGLPGNTVVSSWVAKQLRRGVQ